VGVVEEDAQKLFYASQVGNIVAMLRNPDDLQDAKMRLVDGSVLSGESNTTSVSGYNIYTQSTAAQGVVKPVFSPYESTTEAIPVEEGIPVKSMVIHNKEGQETGK